MFDSIVHWVGIVVQFLVWFYMGGSLFAFLPSIRISELNCFIPQETNPKIKRSMQITRVWWWCVVSIWPLGFIALILYHSGLLS